MRVFGSEERYGRVPIFFHFDADPNSEQWPWPNEATEHPTPKIFIPAQIYLATNLDMARYRTLKITIVCLGYDCS